MNKIIYSSFAAACVAATHTKINSTECVVNQHWVG